MNERVDKFFALPPGKERTAYLDEMIDEMESRRAQWERERASRGEEPRPPRPENAAAGEGGGRPEGQGEGRGWYGGSLRCRQIL